MKKLFFYIILALYFTPLAAQIVISPAFHAVQYVPQEENVGKPCPGIPTVTFTYNGEEVTYGTVVSAGKCWLDRNLGATRVATSSTDEQAYGDLFQWGRADDGHQLIDRDAGVPISGTTDILSNSDNPGHSDFITTDSYPNDWRFSQNDELWQGLNVINTPCPDGWRIPTVAELEAELTSWSNKNSAGAFASPLKLPVAGLRNSNDGSLSGVDSVSYYWSSNVIMSLSRRLVFNNSTASIGTNTRAYGFSVRCIKEL
jgi:hypothetical protein